MAMMRAMKILFGVSAASVSVASCCAAFHRSDGLLELGWQEFVMFQAGVIGFSIGGAMIFNAVEDLLRKWGIIG